jgi:hypothetical protein
MYARVDSPQTFCLWSLCFIFLWQPVISSKGVLPCHHSQLVTGRLRVRYLRKIISALSFDTVKCVFYYIFEVMRMWKLWNFGLVMADSLVPFDGQVVDSRYRLNALSLA